MMIIIFTTLSGVDTQALCPKWCGGIKLIVLSSAMFDFVGLLDKG